MEKRTQERIEDLENLRDKAIAARDTISADHLKGQINELRGGKEYVPLVELVDTSDQAPETPTDPNDLETIAGLKNELKAVTETAGKFQNENHRLKREVLDTIRGCFGRFGVEFKVPTGCSIRGALEILLDGIEAILTTPDAPDEDVEQPADEVTPGVDLVAMKREELRDYAKERGYSIAWGGKDDMIGEIVAHEKAAKETAEK